MVNVTENVLAELEIRIGQWKSDKKVKELDEKLKEKM